MAYNISVGKAKELHRAMLRLGIQEKDIKESFVRSSGPGGQNVNKVSTAVQLYHMPTHISVKYDKERSQAANRFMARKVLVAKIHQHQQDELLQERQAKEKSRRQQRMRPTLAKEKMLEKKHLRSQKKAERKKITFKEIGEASEY